jgi:hypothetical protein
MFRVAEFNGTTHLVYYGCGAKTACGLPIALEVSLRHVEDHYLIGCKKCSGVILSTKLTLKTRAVR